MKIRKICIAAVILSVVCSGCTDTQSGQVVPSEQVGQVEQGGQVDTAESSTPATSDKSNDSIVTSDTGDTASSWGTNDVNSTLSSGGVATASGIPKISVSYDENFKDTTENDDETVYLSNSDESIMVSVYTSYYDKSQDNVILNKNKWLKTNKDKWLYSDIEEKTIGDKDVTYVISGDTETALYHSLKAMYKTGVKVKAYTGEITDLVVNIMITRKDMDFEFSKDEAEEMISLLNEIVPTIELSDMDKVKNQVKTGDDT